MFITQLLHILTHDFAGFSCKVHHTRIYAKTGRAGAKTLWRNALPQSAPGVCNARSAERTLQEWQTRLVFTQKQWFCASFMRRRTRKEDFLTMQTRLLCTLGKASLHRNQGFLMSRHRFFASAECLEQQCRPHFFEVPNM